MKPLYEACFIRIKEHVSEKRSTACTHRYAECQLKNTPTKQNKYIVNRKLEHVDDSVLVEPEFFFLQNKILAQGICIYVGYIF
jgi:hypothetical protein